MFLNQKLFLIEIGVEKVTSIKIKKCKIKCDFADVFSLELADPTQLGIVVPDPVPIRYSNSDKKSVRKVKGNKIKNTNRRKTKRKKLPVEEIKSKELEIKAGQSILFGSNVEDLMDKMNKNPIVLTMYNNDDTSIHVGSTSIPWSGLFIEYLSNITDCKELKPVIIKDQYTFLEENSANLLASVIIEIKLEHFRDNIQTTFREISENSIRKTFLYRGIYSKKTSFMCTFKTNNNDKISKEEKLENKHVEDNKPIQYASYKNIPAVNLNKIVEADANKLSATDINNISNHIKKIITECNDDLRMLTPRPTIKPMIKASNLDRKFIKDIDELNVVCTNKKYIKDETSAFDIEQLRGPCGRYSCKIAKHIRAYILELIKEDKKEITIKEIVGPCGSETCTIADIIREFLLHEGVFKKGSALEGLSTQCSCKEKLNEAFKEKVRIKLEPSTDCDDDKSNEEYDFDVFSSDSHIGGFECEVRKTYIKSINY